MDICIVSNDKKEARFLLLELRDAGFDTSICDSFAMPALLYICDLDFINKDLPENTIGYSYDPEKARRVSLFLPRPIDAMLLRKTAAKLLENSRDQRRARACRQSAYAPRFRPVWGRPPLSQGACASARAEQHQNARAQPRRGIFRRFGQQHHGRLYALPAQKAENGLSGGHHRVETRRRIRAPRGCNRQYFVNFRLYCSKKSLHLQAFLRKKRRLGGECRQASVFFPLSGRGIINRWVYFFVIFLPMVLS